jgi:hypothetical protein
MAQAGKPQVVCEAARSVYDDLVRRINKFETALQADGKLVLEVSSARGVPIETVGLRGETIWFVGQGGAVMIVQHYTKLDVTLVAAPLSKGEERRVIGFLAE